MPKLTLSVDEKVVRGAKRYAAARGTSVSQLVERHLDLLSRPFDPAKAPPVSVFSAAPRAAFRLTQVVGTCSTKESKLRSPVWKTT